MISETKLRSMAATLREMADAFESIAEAIESIQIAPDEPIEALGFTGRLRVSLRRNRIDTIRQLTSFTKNDLLEIRNVGETMVSCIENALKERGLSLRV